MLTAIMHGHEYAFNLQCSTASLHEDRLFLSHFLFDHLASIFLLSTLHCVIPVFRQSLSLSPQCSVVLKASCPLFWHTRSLGTTMPSITAEMEMGGFVCGGVSRSSDAIFSSFKPNLHSHVCCGLQPIWTQYTLTFTQMRSGF